MIVFSDRDNNAGQVDLFLDLGVGEVLIPEGGTGHLLDRGQYFIQILTNHNFIKQLISYPLIYFFINSSVPEKIKDLIQDQGNLKSNKNTFSIFLIIKLIILTTQDRLQTKEVVTENQEVVHIPDVGGLIVIGLDHKY